MTDHVLEELLNKKVIELYLKEDNTMATRKNVTKEEVKKQVELGKAVNARVSEKTKLLKEQNACLAKRCNNLEAQISKLKDELQECSEKNHHLKVQVSEMSDRLTHFKNQWSNACDKIANMTFLEKCFIKGAKELYSENTADMLEKHSKELRKLYGQLDIMTEYYVHKRPIEEIMNSHCMSKYDVESILFDGEKCYEEE